MATERNFSTEERYENADFQPWDKVGVQVEGWLTEPLTLQAEDGGAMVKRHVKDDEGNFTGFLSGKALEPKLIPHQGEYVRITFTGTQDTKNGEMKLHKVEYAS